MADVKTARINALAASRNYLVDPIIDYRTVIGVEGC